MGLLGIKFRCRMGCMVHPHRMDSELDCNQPGADLAAAKLLGHYQKYGTENHWKGSGRGYDENTAKITIYMARFIKKGKSEADKKGDDLRIREAVERIIKEITAHGDAAVRKY